MKLMLIMAGVAILYPYNACSCFIWLLWYQSRYDDGASLSAGLDCESDETARKRSSLSASFSHLNVEGSTELRSDSLTNMLEEYEAENGRAQDMECSTSSKAQV